MPNLTAAINVITDDPHAENCEVQVILTVAQLTAIRNTLDWNVDLETIALDNEEPERASLVSDFIDTVDAALGLSL